MRPRVARVPATMLAFLLVAVGGCAAGGGAAAGVAVRVVMEIAKQIIIRTGAEYVRDIAFPQASKDAPMLEVSYSDSRGLGANAAFLIDGVRSISVKALNGNVAISGNGCSMSVAIAPGSIATIEITGDGAGAAQSCGRDLVPAGPPSAVQTTPPTSRLFSPPTPPSPKPSKATSPSPPAPRNYYLADLDPVSGVPWPESVSLSGVAYPHGVVMYCTRPGLSLVYNVAGKSRFTAMVGIPDDENASGIVLDVFFFDQQRNQLHAVDVALGQPKQVTISLGSTVQLEIFCRGRFTDNKTIGLGLGDAIIHA